ncbi:MAG: 3-phosphoglycerate dehydrogenase, partial [Clostridia bacterium]|nr:3-phosphoglycerate dehydrogenase [Clostridia bacterium]
MFTIKTLNAISNVIYDVLDDKYAVSADAENYDAVIVRSASMHEMELPDSLVSIARAGAGYNNIPVDKCTEKGIVVYNTPGANANAVAELALGLMITASRNVMEGAAFALTLKGNGDQVGPLAEKGKSKFVGGELLGKKLAVI